VPRYGPLTVRKAPATAVSPRSTDPIEVALTRHSEVRQGSPTFKNRFERTMVAIDYLRKYQNPKSPVRQRYVRPCCRMVDIISSANGLSLYWRLIRPMGLLAESATLHCV